MARVYEMSWDGDKKLWYRMYRGVRIKVAVATLEEQGLRVEAYTKDGSRDAANDYFKARRAEIDAARGQAVRPKLPLEDLAAAIHGDPKVFDSTLGVAGIHWQRTEERFEQEARNAAEVRAADPDEGPPYDPDQERLDAVWIVLEPYVKGYLLQGKPLPDELCRQLPAGRCQQIEQGLGIAAGKPNTSEDKTIRTWAIKWITFQEGQARGEIRSAARVENKQRDLNRFIEFYGGDNYPADQITAQTLDLYYAHLLERLRTKTNPDGWSEYTCRDKMAVVKEFVRYLVKHDACERPKNLDDKFPFGIKAEVKTAWSIKEFQLGLAATDKPIRQYQRLHLGLLLMANCGMTQQDIGSLVAIEIDWQEGRITRRRSKTRRHKQPPTVSYKLWPTTWELLQKHGNRQGLVFTVNGEPIVRLDHGGKKARKDLLGDQWRRVRQKLSFQKSLKGIRKMGQSLIKGSREFNKLNNYYLANVPGDIADRHYSDDDLGVRQFFDEAVLWLGRQLGQVTPEPVP
jgi:integrase